MIIAAVLELELHEADVDLELWAPALAQAVEALHAVTSATVVALDVVPDEAPA